MDRKEHIEYWRETAAKDFITMEHLFDSGDYHWALFMGHLVLEKLLKAAFIASSKEALNAAIPPRSHDLVRLAQYAGLSFDEQTRQKLDLINTFNIATRYPDYQRKIYEICTKQYAQEQITIVGELRIWLLQALKQQ